MNNKKIGIAFEKKLCEAFANKGYWVHFMSPDARGAQPFDVIAIRDDIPIAIDCKTCEDHIFRISRLEDNQMLAFDKWISCGNTLVYLAVLHDGRVYLVNYKMLKETGKVDLDSMEDSKWLTCAD